MMPWRTVVACGWLAIGTAAPASAVLSELQSQDIWVEAVGYRLATANADFCPGGWTPGFSVHTPEQYGDRYRDAAARKFRLKDHVGVMSVVAGSPAATAGLQPGDAIVQIDGFGMPTGKSRSASADFTRTGAAQLVIARAFSDGTARLSLMREGKAVALELAAARACPTIFQVVPEGTMNAEADGRYVQIATDLVALAQSDDELAAVLAHELAHNILNHRAELDRLRVDRGLLAGIGRNARLVRQTEVEADRLSIYLMARAGYTAERAILFWQRVRHATRRLLPDRTHPRWSERLRTMQLAIDRIAAGEIRLPADLERKLLLASQQPD
jgi:hypothetical protein